MQVRWIATVLALTLVVGCADKDPLVAAASIVAGPSKTASIVGDEYFLALSWIPDANGVKLYRGWPITTLPYNTVDGPPPDKPSTVNWHDEHIFINHPGTYLWLRDEILAHPGKLYIVGDEFDARENPIDYAREYCDFAYNVHGYDATARFSPTILSDWIYTGWLWEFEAAHDTVRNGQCASIPIAEWIISLVATNSTPLQTWKDRVDFWANWAQSSARHPAPFVLGTWNLDYPASVPNEDGAYVARLLEARKWLAANPRVTHTIYQNYNGTDDPEIGHPLAYADGATMTPEGFVLGGYLADNVNYVIAQDNISGALQLRRVYWQPEVWIAGTRYYSAIGMHAPYTGTGWAEFRIPPGAQAFTFVFGLARDDHNPCYGEGLGRVKVDGVTRWELPIAGSSLSTAVNGSLSLPAGASTIRLETEALNGNNSCAQTTWGDPHFEPSKIAVSGPTTISQADLYTWTANTAGFYDGVSSIRWDAKKATDPDWTVSVCSGATCSHEFNGGEGPYTYILRAIAFTSTGRVQISQSYTVTVNQLPTSPRH